MLKGTVVVYRNCVMESLWVLVALPLAKRLCNKDPDQDWRCTRLRYSNRTFSVSIIVDSVMEFFQICLHLYIQLSTLVCLKGLVHQLV